MGWYACYMAMKENKVSSSSELRKVNRRDWNFANKTNVSDQRVDAWKFAENKLKEDNEKT